MQFQGTVNIAAKQTAVWHILTTPTIISQCAPRLQQWKMLDNNSQFQLQFAWGSGRKIILIPLQLTWQSSTPPNQLRWQANAQMGSTILPLNGEFNLTSRSPQATVLAFTAKMEPTNKLLQQMIQTTAPRLIDSFFHCIKKTAEAV